MSVEPIPGAGQTGGISPSHLEQVYSNVFPERKACANYYKEQ